MVDSIRPRHAVRFLLILALVFTAGSSTATEVIVDGTFENQKNGADLRKDSKGPDWYESRKETEESAKLLKAAQDLGIGAQFGGKYFAHDVRVIRLPRHGASCPVGMAVSCSADRNIKAKSTRDGVFLEQLEHDPAKYAPANLGKETDDAPVVELNRPRSDVLADL